MEWGDYYMNEDDYAMQVGMGAGYRVGRFFCFFLFAFSEDIWGTKLVKHVVILYRRTVRSLRVILTLSTREGETRRRKGRLRARTHLTTQNLEDLRRRRKPETRRPMTVSFS